MRSLGDVTRGTTLFFTFSTHKADHTPLAPVGAAVSIYKDANTTQSTLGVTLTTDFDGQLGLNAVQIDVSDEWYTVGSEYSVVITAGTVDGISIAGTTLAHFSVGNRICAATYTRVGNPVALDGGGATIAGMLTKLADDNGGASYDATTDSQRSTASNAAEALTRIPDATPGASGGLPVLNAALEVPKVKTVTDPVTSTGGDAPTVAEIVAALAAHEITVTSPVSTSGDITIVAGDDYASGEILWTLDKDELDLTGATVTLVLADGTSLACTVTDPGGANQSITLALTDTQSAALSSQNFCIGVVSGTTTKTPIFGRLNVVRRP